MTKAAKTPISPMEYPIHEIQVLARMQRELLSAEQIDREKVQILAKVIEEKLAKMRAAWDQALRARKNSDQQARRVHGAPDQIM